MIKKISGVIFFFWAATASAQPARHVILVSIDGFRTEHYTSPDFTTPNLRKLMSDGLWAKGINSVFPSITYPSHTSMITGAYPGKHGIYYNQQYATGKNYYDEKDILVPTLWDALKKKNLPGASIMWPITVGAPITYNFPVRRAHADEKGDQLMMTRPVVSPPGLIDEFDQAFGTLSKENFSGENADPTYGRMANYIFTTYKPALMAVHFISVDHLEHETGLESEDVKRGITRIDSIIGALVATVRKSGLEATTTIIITGDHGFLPTSTAFAPNVLLAKAGLLEKARFHGVGGSGFLYLKDKNDHETLREVNGLLKRVADPGYRAMMYRTIDRAGLDSMGVNPEVSLAIALRPGAVVIADEKGGLIRDRKGGGNHGSMPVFPGIQTGLILYGAGVNAKTVFDKEMNVTDIAPLIAKLLELDFKAPDGKLRDGLLK